MLNLYTIGYTEKTAEYFFSKLKSTSAKTQSGKSYAKEFLADSVLLCSEKNSTEDLQQNISIENSITVFLLFI